MRDTWATSRRCRCRRPAAVQHRTSCRRPAPYAIEQGGKTFYLGGYGEFDSLAASVLREMKKLYPQIELILVLPYLNASKDALGYDGTVYPPLESVPPRYAISKRNQWMVEVSDVVVAYVLHSWGGAATTLRYAKRKNKRIILYEIMRKRDED